MPLPPAFTLSDFLTARAHARQQPAPWVSFYELELPDGTFRRYVSLYDPRSGGSLPDRVVFNSLEWTAASVTRGQLQESSDGSNLTFELAVGDLKHEGAALVRLYEGLEGQPLRIYSTTYDALATPTDSFLEEYEVVEAHIGQGPDRVQLTVGHGNLFEEEFPSTLYERKCFNSWQKRFEPENPCHYPSNEFGPSHQQNLRAGATIGIRAVKHGWQTQQSLRASTFYINQLAPHKLRIISSAQKIAWLDDDRYGPNFFRILSGDFDLHTVVSVLPTTRTGWMAGLLVQDEAAAINLPLDVTEEPSQVADSSWLYWGLIQRLGGGSPFSDVLRRKTVANVSTSARTTVSDTRLRLVRVGSTWSLYSRVTDAAAWTLRYTETLTLPTAVRIGLVLAADTDGTQEFGATVDYIRFTAGGEAQCSRLKSRCRELKNLIQFNGFEGIPDDRARF
jgi:hypothetical protein